MASIAFAILAAILMQSFQIGVFNNLIKNVVGYYSGYVQIHQKGYWDEQVLDNCFVVDDALKNKLKQHPEINKLVPRLETFILASKESIPFLFCTVDTISSVNGSVWNFIRF